MPNKEYYAKNKERLIQYSRDYYKKNREYILKTVAEKKKYLKKNGRCIQCQKQDAFTLNGRSLCAECAEKINEYHKNNCDKQKEAERQKSRYAKLKEQGICTRCGKRPADVGVTVCSMCRAELKQMRTEERRRKNIFPKGEDGYCARCNKEKAIEGHKVCQSCYDYLLNHIKSISNNNENHKWKAFDDLIFNKKVV